MQRVRLFYLPVLALTSCGLFTPKDVTNPSDISVAKAMTDVAEGFNSYRDTLRYETVVENGQQIRKERRERVGMYACELDIAFNVAASANAERGLVIDGKLTDPSGSASLGGQGSGKNAAGAARGNVVNFKLENPVCSSLRGVMVGRTHRTTTVKEGDKTTTIVEDIEITPKQIVDLLRAMAGNESYLRDGRNQGSATGPVIRAPRVSNRPVGSSSNDPVAAPPVISDPIISAPAVRRPEPAISAPMM